MQTTETVREDTPESKKADFKKKLKMFLIIAILAILFIALMCCASVGVAILCNKFDYLNTSNIIFISSYIVGIPIVLIINFVATSLFGNVSIKDLWHTELTRLINSLILYMLICVLGRESEILMDLCVGYLILAVITHTLSKSLQIALNKPRAILNATTWCFIVNSIAVGTASGYMTLFSKSLNQNIILMIVLLAVHLASLVVLIRNKLRYITVLILTMVATLSIYVYVTNELSDSLYLKDFYNSGYDSIMKLQDYEKEKGNLYTVYQAVGEEVTYIISDNTNFANLGKNDTDYTYSLYESTQSYIVFNWTTRQVVLNINKDEIHQQAKEALKKNFEISHSDIGNGVVNVVTSNGELVSLYLRPTEQGIELVYTAKDMSKYNIVEQVADAISK
jgi:hypothetical protein